MRSVPSPAFIPDPRFGALLRHYRETAGLSQEALAERAGMSARAVRYLERGASHPYPDTLRRLAEALALTPAHQEALAEAARAPDVPASLHAAAAIPASLSLSPAPPLVGREQELSVLRGCLATSLAGQGGLVLISGEAGVGKSALAESVCREAVEQDALVLIGRCYDLSETPPYGPWTEARAQFPPSPDLPPPPSALHTAAQSPGQFFAEVRDFFVAAAARHPIVLLLDDLHWADPASLDLLRFLARSLGTLRFLLLASYRPGELDRHHPLSRLIPLLVREARAERLDLAPLSATALHTLVHERYCLDAADEARLVTYLTRRTEGNALFAHEMLRALEERGVVATGGETLGNLEGVAVPSLLRQIVAGRVARLGTEAEHLLGVAAVIGQEVPLAVWVAIAGSDDETVEAVAERGLAARLFVETRHGEGVAFAHALIREALYAEVPALRRRRLHRAVGEELAASKDAAPDAVAYHFRAAGDTRAAAWLTWAGWEAYRAFAYATARARFEEALLQIEGSERARTLLALAALDRFREQGIRYAEEAVATAYAAGDEILMAVARFRLGINLSYHGRVGEALAATEVAEHALEDVPDDALPDFYGLISLALSHATRRDYRAGVLACSGRWHEVFALLGGAPETVPAGLTSLTANDAVAVWHASILLGRLATARQILATILASFVTREDDLAVLAAHVSEGSLLLLPFSLDDREARQRYDGELAGAIRRVEEAHGAVPPYLNRCPLLIAAGRWAEARALWAQRRDTAMTTDLAGNLPYVGAMARAQGESEEAWALVYEGLPDGPRTEPGTTHYAAVDLHCLAARLALDEVNHAQARQWLEAHDRWLTWAGQEVRWGRANGQLAWAEYHRAIGETEAAVRRAEEALIAATAPRQPLLLLASHRLLGELHREVEHPSKARTHLDAALVLADACGAPYERALTLIACAELDASDGNTASAVGALHEVRAICTSLGASLSLTRAAALVATLADDPRPA